MVLYDLGWRYDEMTEQWQDPAVVSNPQTIRKINGKPHVYDHALKAYRELT